jgi:hypothetical protein
MLILPDIVEIYIRPGAPYQLNIDGPMIGRVMAKAAKCLSATKPKRDLFAEPEREVLRLMATNDFPRLKQSPCTLLVIVARLFCAKRVKLCAVLCCVVLCCVGVVLCCVVQFGLW